MLGLAGGIIMSVAALLFFVVFFGTIFSKPREEAVLELPVSQALHDEKRVPLFDNFKPWLGNDGCDYRDCLHAGAARLGTQPRPGAPRFTPENPTPMETNKTPSTSKPTAQVKQRWLYQNNATHLQHMAVGGAAGAVQRVWPCNLVPEPVFIPAGSGPGRPPHNRFPAAESTRSDSFLKDWESKSSLRIISLRIVRPFAQRWCTSSNACRRMPASKTFHCFVYGRPGARFNSQAAGLCNEAWAFEKLGPAYRR
jgi:hypothetical protein